MKHFSAHPKRSTGATASRAPFAAVQGNIVLPTHVEMVDGNRFAVPADGVWAFGPGQRVLNTKELDRRSNRGRKSPPRDSVFSPGFTMLLRLFMLDRLRRVNPNGLNNYFNGFCTFERWLYDHGGWEQRLRSFGLGNLTVEIYDQYRIWSEEHTRARGASCLALRKLYAWSAEAPGYSQSVHLTIRGLDLKKAVAGKAARFRDPLRGPFDQWEQEQITEALYEEAGGQPYAVHRAVVGVFREIGARPKARADDAPTSATRRTSRRGTSVHGRRPSSETEGRRHDL